MCFLLAFYELKGLMRPGKVLSTSNEAKTQLMHIDESNPFLHHFYLNAITLPCELVNPSGI
ncbi:MAG TPA: hypothetical protein DGB85_13305 [Deltaproteobacteria bacterium]|nr:hypothetical protein [Deltaproteobacteria bacterium]